MAVAAASDISHHRGGPGLLETWLGDRDQAEALEASEEKLAGRLHQLFVAVNEEEALGLALAALGPSAGFVALFVRPEARRQGAGHQLSASALAWLESSGVGSIDTIALPGDREMKNLWEQAGFKARLLTLRRDG